MSRQPTNTARHLTGWLVALVIWICVGAAVAYWIAKR